MSERDDTAPGSAGRGMLVDDDVSEDKREAMEAGIREMRRSAWTPD